MFFFNLFNAASSHLIKIHEPNINLNIFILAVKITH